MTTPLPLKIHLHRFNVNVSSKVTLSCQRWCISSRVTDSTKNNANNSKQRNDNDDDDAAAAAAHQQEQQQPGRTSTTCVVFCHQYGKMGGSGGLLVSMAHRLIYESVGIGRNYSSQNHQNQNQSIVVNLGNAYDAVTFDMRGVGKSTGSATFTCADEVSDVTAVCDHLIKNEKYSKIFLVGSSAGAVITGSALDSCTEIAACAVIGYTFGWAASVLFSSHYKAFLNSTKPKLLIHGTEDGFTSNGQFEDLMKKLKGDCNENVIIEGVGHFEMEQPNYDGFMAEKIVAFFRKF